MDRFQQTVTSMSEVRFFAFVLTPILLVFLATATWTTYRSPDPFTNMDTAWSIANEGTIYLDHNADLVPYQGHLAWIVETENGRPVSIYPPGAALHAVPFYLLSPQEPQIRLVDAGDSFPDDPPVAVFTPPLAIGALVGALTTALAAATIALTARRFVHPPVAAAGAYLFAFGTSAFTIAADDLWQHGPAMLWISVGIFLASRERQWLSGAALGVAILVRPPVAIVAAAIGITMAIRERKLAPAIRIGAGSLAGLVALFAYNLAVFGSANGAYGEHFNGNLTSTDLPAYLVNIAGGLFGLQTGILIYSPFLMVTLVGVIRARPRVPAGVLGAAVGGAIYLLISWKAEHYSGGGGFFGYRYPQEAVAAAFPLLIAGWSWIALNTRRVAVFGLLAFYSLLVYSLAQIVSATTSA